MVDQKYLVIIVVLIFLGAGVLGIMSIDFEEESDDNGGENPLETENNSGDGVLTPPNTQEIDVVVDSEGFSVRNMGEAERIIVFNNQEEREVFSPGEYQWRNEVNSTKRYRVSAVFDNGEIFEVDSGFIEP